MDNRSVVIGVEPPSLMHVTQSRKTRSIGTSRPQRHTKKLIDVTFVPTQEGWLYLAAMIDLYNRDVIGWAIGACNDTDLILRALDMALATHRPPQGLNYHSDRGSTYTAKDYRRPIAERGILCSMSGTGNCWDTPWRRVYLLRSKKNRSTDIIMQLGAKLQRPYSITSQCSKIGFESNQRWAI